jgi:hypothetical protein
MPPGLVVDLASSCIFDIYIDCFIFDLRCIYDIFIDFDYMCISHTHTHTHI